VTEFEEFGVAGPLGLIAFTVAETLRAEGVDGAEADEIARRVAWAIADEFGGQYWFVPLHDGAQEADPPLILFVAVVLEREVKGHVSDARALAARCASECRKMIGGDYLYVMRGASAKRKSRDQKIWNAFTGTNYRALSKEFDLSEMRVRQIIQKQRERRAQFRGK
jgi:Mor family transcriptional regulator